MHKFKMYNGVFEIFILPLPLSLTLSQLASIRSA